MAIITTSDVASLFRSLTSEETTRCGALIPIVEDALRIQIRKTFRKDLDTEMHLDSELENVVKGILVSAIARVLTQNDNSMIMSQTSESALGYSVSGTYAIPGGGMIQFMNSDMDKLPFRRPYQMGVIDLC